MHKLLNSFITYFNVIFSNIEIVRIWTYFNNITYFMFLWIEWLQNSNIHGLLKLLHTQFSKHKSFCKILKFLKQDLWFFASFILTRYARQKLQYFAKGIYSIERRRGNSSAHRTTYQCFEVSLCLDPKETRRVYKSVWSIPSKQHALIYWLKICNFWPSCIVLNIFISDIVNLKR